MKVKVNGNVYRKGEGDRWVSVSELPDFFNEIEVADTDYQEDVARKMLDFGEGTNVFSEPVEVEKFLSESTIILSVGFVDHGGFQSKLLLWCKSDRRLSRRGSPEFWTEAQAAGVSLPIV